MAGSDGNLRPEILTRGLALRQHPISLSPPEDGEGALVELPSPDPSPEHLAATTEAVERVTAALSVDQETLLRQRYIEELTLQQIADADGVTRQRVHQREQAALVIASRRFASNLHPPMQTILTIQMDE